MLHDKNDNTSVSIKEKAANVISNQFAPEDGTNYVI